MSTFNEDAKKMKNDTMSSTEKRDSEIESIGSANLVRNDASTMSIRSLMSEFVDDYSERRPDRGYLADMPKVLLDMGRFIDIDGSVSDVTKLDYVRYSELLRSDGKSNYEIMRNYSLFSDFFEWAEDHGAGSSKTHHPNTYYDRVEDYEGLMEQIDALFEKNWKELWNSVMPKELR